MTLLDGLLLLAAYLAGAIPFGYLFTRARTGKDIRTMGSGNIGATNVLRTQGKLLGFLTLLLDFGKAALSVWFCGRWGNSDWMGAAGGGAAVLGHCFPVFLAFRGGKGIASGLGAFLFIAPVPALMALGVFVVELLALRWVALGSVLASLTFGVSIVALHFLFGWYSLPVACIGAGTSLLMVARHQRNLRNLLAGTEPKLWGRGSLRERSKP